MPAGSKEELDKLAGDYETIAKKYGDGLQGKNAIITGSNTGLGYEMARALSACGINVIVATRNPEKGEKAVEDLQQKEVSASKGKVEFMHLDLASLKSVSSFVTEYRKRNTPLDILANNASAWMTPEAMSPTEDGFEYQVASHYFGHVYLTELLKDKLFSASPSRLIWTTSAAETLGAINWDCLEMSDRASNFNTYGTVKLYGTMVARIYAKQFKEKNVGVYAGQPGMSSTDFFNPEKFDWLKPAATSQWLLQKFVGITSEEGAWPLIFSAIAPVDELKTTETGLSMGPEYYQVGKGGVLDKLQAPQITNKGLIRYNEPQNESLKDLAQCQRLYDETIKILKSKPPVKNGPKFGQFAA